MGDSEYFADKRVKYQTQLEKEYNCDKNSHQWSNWFCVPAGLAKECKICHKTEILEKKERDSYF